MNLKLLSHSYLNKTTRGYNPDFINLAQIKEDRLAFDQKTRFLNDALKAELNGQEIERFDDALYIVERNERYSLLCNVDMEMYRQGHIITHELVLPDIIQGMLSNLLVYNAETAPIFLMSREDLHLEQMVERVPHKTVSYSDSQVHIFQGEDAQKVLSFLENVETLIVGDGHHRLYTSSLWDQKKTIFTHIMSLKDVDIQSIDRIIPNVEDDDFEKARVFIERQFQVLDANTPMTKGIIRITRGTCSFCVKLIDLESNSFWNNDVYRLNTQILSQAFGIFDTSLLKYYVNSQECGEECVRNPHHVHIELSPITKDEVIFVSEKRAIMPPKSTAFEPKFPSFFVFNRYR